MVHSDLQNHLIKNNDSSMILQWGELQPEPQNLITYLKNEEKRPYQNLAKDTLTSFLQKILSHAFAEQ